MKRLLLILIFFICSPLFCFEAVVILPFSNESQKQEIYWLGEGFAESLSEEMLLQNAYLIQRPERRGAYEALHLPYMGDLSRATMLKIGDKLSATYVVFGSYNLKGNNLSVEARVIKLPSAGLSDKIEAIGSLENLYELQISLRNGLVRYFESQKLASVPEKSSAALSVPLHAYEWYIKGLLEGSDEERIKFFQRAIQAKPGYGQAIYRLGLTLSKLQRYKESNEFLQRATFSTAIKSKAEFLIALNSYFAGNFEAASEKWIELLKTDPTSEVLNNIGVALIRKSSFQDSGWYLSRALELDPKNSNFRFNLAASYVLRSYDKNAIQQFLEVIRMRPGDYQAFYLLAKLLDREKNSASKKVMQFFMETLPSDLKGKFPEQYTSVSQLVRPALLFLSKEEKAYFGFAEEKNRNQRTNYVKTYQNNARRHLEEEDATSGIIEIRKGLSLSPFDWYLHYLWALALVQQKNLSAAFPELEFSIWCQDNVESHLLLAEIYRQAEKYADAKLQVQRSLALDPDNKKALDIWGKIWDKQ